MVHSLFEQRPWQSDLADEESGPPGLLDSRESAMYTALARDYFRGSGAVVDCGSFLGRSAYFIATGFAANPVRPPGAVIDCFDNFRVNDEYTRQFLLERVGVDLPLGASTRALFERGIASFRDLLVVHGDDLLACSWGDEPVELLFVDIAKTPELNSKVIELFFPRLIPNRSVVVQQDYHHPWLPHVIVGMEFLADCFELVEPRADDSAVFSCKRPIPRDRLEAAIAYRFSYDEQLALIDRAIARLPEDCRHVVGLARVYLIGTNEGPAAMERALRALCEESAGISDDHSWQQYLTGVTEWLEEHR